MDDRIVAVARTIAQIFSDAYRLELPYFQRGYAWQPAHVARLLADILRMADGEGEIDWYPLGSIILAKRPEDPEAWVADGHQRLISLTIMIAILRDLERDQSIRARLQGCIGALEPSGGLRFRLVTSESASDCLRDFVQTEASTTLSDEDLDDDLSANARNVLQNRNHLHHEIAKLDRERRRRLARFLLDRCLLVVEQVRDQKVASMLFATMHDTGIRPTTLDLFKAQVLSQMHADHRDGCQDIWERLEASLGQDRFDALLGHILLIETRAMSRRPVHEALKARFELDEATAARDFVERHLARIGGHFVDLCDADLRESDIPVPVRRRLQYMGWVRNHDTWAAPVLHWLDRMGPEHAGTGEFMRRIEALAWAQMITAVDHAQRTARYLEVLADIDAGRALEGGSAIVVTAAERDRVRAVLSAPNYTNKPYKLFLLVRANAALDGDDALHRFPDPTIEHIFPKRPSPTGPWSRIFRGQAEAKRFRSAFGNLTLITKAEQNQAKNLGFDAKRPVLAGSAFALSRRLGGRQGWGPEEVGRSTDELVDILMASWGWHRA